METNETLKMALLQETETGIIKMMEQLETLRTKTGRNVQTTALLLTARVPEQRYYV